MGEEEEEEEAVVVDALSAAGGAAAADSTSSPRCRPAITPFPALQDGLAQSPISQVSRPASTLHRLSSNMVLENLDGARTWVLKWADKQAAGEGSYPLPSLFACTCAYFDTEDHT